MMQLTLSKPFEILGIMSGTSLDGVDLAHCTFTGTKGKISYELKACTTIPYPAEWIEILKNLPDATALEYAAAHVRYGKYLGEQARKFLDDTGLRAEYIASHGHTIFHQPAGGFTGQIGDGAALAAAAGVKVICDFRSSDVAHGGQGAPLVPAGDAILFGGYSHCLNIGGFANISFESPTGRLAYDVCPANFVLNHFARLLGKDFDANGELAASGKVIPGLLEQLNSLTYYHQMPPKSLGREWVEKDFLPVIPASADLPDVLRTLTEHIAFQVGRSADATSKGSMLVTGGGAFNRFLMERLRIYSPVPVTVPDRRTVEFKEALIFAFLGLLRVLEQPNCLASVTGADKNVCGGAVYLP